ncbi:MAG: heterodisulfide reductase, partial [Deltaproteobacteria bacterium]
MNIALLTLSEITEIHGREGNFTVSITKYPRYVDMEKCIACGLCAEKCPAKTIDVFNEGLNRRRAIYVPYPQAVPLKYVIEADQCIYFKKKGRCRACEKFCPTGAINFDDQKEDITIDVGSVILTAGYKPFNPGPLDNYQHGRLPNVVTGMEFERILAAGGPTGGHVRRPSDGNTARRIAWLQCVGSRDINRCDNAYCSSVCCMYAIKEAVVAGEHVGARYEGTIFHMDIRTFGKDFEKYYNRAKDRGVRFIRSRVHSITEKNSTGTLTLTYVTEAGRNISEDFDMAVLSVGMEPDESAVDAARNLGIGLNPFNFVKTDDLDPVATTRPGIYVAGVLQGCKDIPSSIMEASAAACRAGISLAGSRGSLVRSRKFPDEISTDSAEPRIGVFVCNCGLNIGGLADVPAIAEYAGQLPGVAHVEENLFTCAQDTQDKLARVIKEKNLNRIVVAACTPRTHEALFQETIRNAGLNPYLFEMANIRNQCTWCHSEDRDRATEKAKDMVRMAISRAALLEPIPELSVPVKKSALVIGGGVAGMTAALSLADQGFPAVLVERSGKLGGNALDLLKTWRGSNVKRFVSGLIRQVEAHPDISVLLNTCITGASGFVGNFETVVRTGDLSRTIAHGATIIAIGGRATDTDEYLYGRNPRVTRWHDLDKAPDRLKDARSIVFIQC